MIQSCKLQHKNPLEICFVAIFFFNNTAQIYFFEYT